MRTRIIASGLFVFAIAAHAIAATDLQSRIDRIPQAAGPLEIRGRGFVTDSSHPKRPGDVHRDNLTFRFMIDPRTGDGSLEFTTGEPEKPAIDRYFVRRGAPFQQNEKGDEISASSFGDLSPSTIAALNPALVARAIATRRENVHPLREERDTLLLSWNDELWRAQLDRTTSDILKLKRRLYHAVHGDRAEEVRYESYRRTGSSSVPHRVVVTSDGRDIAAFEVTSVSPLAARPPLPEEKENHEKRLLTGEDVTFTELAPHLFAIDLVPTNSRVFVAEFKDHVVVLEGAYNSHNGDVLAEKIVERFSKPIRFFAFSHLHGQYVGGVRSYVQRGAAVIVPPTTVPLVEAAVKARHELRPDAQTRRPRDLRTETVKDKRVLRDDTNTLEIHNVESEHTDEYLLFYFPRQKVLLTGDLLFYRGPDQPLRGRSVKLCSTAAAIAPDAETMFVSWPLEGYGVRNKVTGAELRAACTTPPSQ